MRLRLFLIAVVCMALSACAGTTCPAATPGKIVETEVVSGSVVKHLPVHVTGPGGASATFVYAYDVNGKLENCSQVPTNSFLNQLIPSGLQAAAPVGTFLYPILK